MNFRILPAGTEPENFKFDDIFALIGQWEDVLLALAMMAVFLLLLWSGIMYLTAYGSEEKALKAKNTFFWAIIGIIIILLSKLILYEIADVFSTPGSGVTTQP